MGNYIGLILLIILLYQSRRTEGNILDVTGFNAKPILDYPPGSSVDTFFGGYTSGADTDATITLGRALDTDTGPLTLPEIPQVAYYEYALERSAYRLRLKAGVGMERIGAFHINATKNDISHSMVTITMAKSATVKPESQTKTVSVGQNVTLTMTPVNSPVELQWRFNGVVKNSWQDSLLHIASVTKADEGIYECYVIGDRSLGRQAIVRLIVRDCPSSWWGPPSCQQECPVCYNGGECDAQTGICVCPPAFGGANCEVLYGRNQWGNDGGIVCSKNGGKHGTACRGAFFCRPDPYGCSCMAGYKGLDCTTDCDSGTFGADCTQQCHCVGDSCLFDTGECSSGVLCKPGWRGANCQVPDPCPVGYYGDICTDRCRCIDNEPCNGQTGSCANGCQPGYIGDSCVDDGAPKITGFVKEMKVNSGATTTLICTVTGNPIPKKAQINVTNSDGAMLTFINTEKHNRQYEREVWYGVNVTTSGEVFTCTLSLQNGPAVAQETFAVDVYAPPVLPNPPTIEDITASSLRVRWQNWESSFGGDGPVTKYIVKYRNATSDPDAPYQYMVENPDGRATSVGVTGLQVNSDYGFVVIAVREGNRGEGPASPEANATTLCDVPTAPPVITGVTAHNSTALIVSWQLPPESTWLCKTLQRINVLISGLRSETKNVDLSIPGYDTMVEFTSLEACTMYDFSAYIVNSAGEGPVALGSTGNTSIAVPGPVLNLRPQSSSTNSTVIGITWEQPDANLCPVDGYQVTFAKVARLACEGSMIMPKNITVSSAEVVFHLFNLEPYSTYHIFVSAMNEMGEGAVESIMASTLKDKPSAAPLPAWSTPGEKSRLRFTWMSLDCAKLNGRFVGYFYQLTNSNYNTEIVKEDWIYDQFENLSVTIDNLTPCTDYGFRIRVVSNAGTGPYSERVIGTTENDLPGPVSMLSVPSASVTPYEMFIQWQEPSHPPCLIDHYKIRLDLINRDKCNETERPPAISMTRDLNYTATGLVPNSEYEVTVKAMTISVSGYGERMITMATTKESVPTMGPTNLKTPKGAIQMNSLAFRWDLPPCGFRGGVITHYSYKFTDLLRNNVITANVNNTWFSIADLTAFVEYKFEVRAFTSAGPGPYSDPLVVRTLQSRPGIPTNVTTPSANSESIIVRWYPPNPPLANITSYEIEYWLATEGEMDNELRSRRYNVSNLQPPYEYEIMDLNPLTKYSIHIRALNTDGLYGLFIMPPVQRITMEDIPSAPVNLRLDSKQETQITVSWDIPRQPNGDITQYLVRYKIVEKLYERRSRLEQFAYVNLTMTNPMIRHVTIDNLEPSSKYQAEVAASTSAGTGPYESLLVYTRPPSKFDPPESKPGYDPTVALASVTTLQITLAPVTSKYVTHTWIRVDKTSLKRAATIGSYQDNPNSYVAAELDKDSMMFMVGDNETYGGFSNPPLQKGATYEISQGSVSKSDDEVNVVWGPETIYTAGGIVDGSSGGDTSGNSGGGSDMTSVIVGVVLGIAIVCFLAAAIAFVIIKKRQHQTPRNRPKDETNLMQLNNVLVNKNETNLNTRGKLKNTNSEPPLGKSKMKHSQSDDAISNIGARKTVKSLPSPAIVTAVEKHKPIKVDKLADYVKNKQTDGLKMEYGTLPEGKRHQWAVAMKPENKVKNRYANIIAYDHSRVKLMPLEGDPHSDYINACFVNGYGRNNAFIACQGPNLASINDIWRMIWQEKTAKIIMVTNLNEGGKKKCEKYWPDNSKTYRDIEVRLITENKFPNYCTRTFSLQKDGEMRELTQFHYISWPDMGVPSYATPLLKFINATKEYNPPKSGPTIVHCSAGVGRTGTFITISTMLDQAKHEQQVDIYNFILNMRDRRIKMVQTAEQYGFIFDALLEALICGDTSCTTEAFYSEFHRLKTKTNSAGKSLIQEQFETLEIVSQKASPQKCRGGCDQLNVNKNRYPERLPFDKFRPYLMTDAGENCTNYINASFLDGYNRKNMFFATQSPLPHTALDFWRLIFDYNSSTIVMLNAMDHNDASICQYWPESGNQSFGPFTIELISTDNSHHIITRTFHLTNQQRKLEEPRKICHFQYTGWSNNQTVPKSPDTLIELYNQIERWCPQAQGDSPITVHCLDGMGVTGTFCTLYMVLDRLKTEQSIDVFQAVKKLRMTRTNMVNSLEQYIFCFETVLAYLDSMELYGNFK